MAISIDIKETELWKRAFSHKPNDATAIKELTESLLAELRAMRSKVDEITKSIQADMPGLTVHDLSHLDAVWEMADRIFNVKDSINPAEGFVLASAILIHDAALTLAAYPNGINDLMGTVEWKDAIRIELRKAGHEKANAIDPANPPEEVRKAVVWQLLRKKHAEQATTMTTQEWRYGNKSQFLIDNLEFREEFGEIIGQIAASHHWPIDQVQNTFSDPLSHIVGAPSSWTVDALKLACILRVADAIQVDSRRAPIFRFLLSQPSGTSLDHWTYQQKLRPPTLKNGQLKFDSRSSFTPDQAEAWWLCYEWLKMADREIQDANSLLVENNRAPLACSGIHGNTASSLAKTVKVKDWAPIDCTLQISDIPSLIKRFGGESLYGDHPEVVIRELVQNAADAVRARELLIGSHEGKISLSIESDEKGAFLCVQDNGVGMSTKTLTRSLLDFGTSFWRSDQVVDEFPGLIGNGFQAGGQFGIGFFSVFMLGKRVSVVSRRYNAGYDDTYELQFRSGLNLRPVLLKTDGSLLPEAGTMVRVWLENYEFGDLRELTYRLFPALEVNLFVKPYREKAELVIKAGDWRTAAFDDLTFRLSDRSSRENSWLPASELRSNEKLIGRAAIPTRRYVNARGVVVDEQGIMICERGDFVGVIQGAVTTAKRDEARLIADRKCRQQWANDQAKLLLQANLPAQETLLAAHNLIRFNTTSKKIPILYHDGVLITEAEFAGLIEGQSLFAVLLASELSTCIDFEDEAEGLLMYELSHKDSGFPVFMGVDCTFAGRLSSAHEQPLIERLTRVTGNVWKGIPRVSYFESDEWKDFLDSEYDPRETYPEVYHFRTAEA